MEIEWLVHGLDSAAVIWCNLAIVGCRVIQLIVCHHQGSPIADSLLSDGSQIHQTKRSCQMITWHALKTKDEGGWERANLLKAIAGLTRSCHHRNTTKADTTRQPKKNPILIAMLTSLSIVWRIFPLVWSGWRAKHTPNIDTNFSSQRSRLFSPLRSECFLLLSWFKFLRLSFWALFSFTYSSITF